MNGCIRFYCRNCKCTTDMEITDIVSRLRIYRLKCKTCGENWRVPVDMLDETLHEPKKCTGGVR